MGKSRIPLPKQVEQTHKDVRQYDRKNSKRVYITDPDEEDFSNSYIPAEEDKHVL